MVIIIVKRGARISRRGSALCISRPVPIKNGKDETNKKYQFITENIPLIDIEMLVIVGSNVRISSGAMLMLAEANIPIIVHSRRLDATLLTPYNVRIAEVRRRLYRLADNTEWRTHIGRVFIEGKLSGLANVIRYLAYKDIEKGKNVKWVLEEIDDINKLRRAEASNIKSIKDLRLYEAKWSKKLWELLVTFIPNEYEFTGRDPKSKDPVNSAISYAYAVIYGLCTHALIASGLDPYVGIVHSERAGRTSLTYDFSEMFKPVAIHAVMIASRLARLSIDKYGYLTKRSLETVTRLLYRALRRKHRSWKYSVRGEIYAKAWELRQNIEKGLRFRPFTYAIK
ncbi:MAG: CRISPR-associated endonuclease Cas1 [Thermoprotei archaeon]|nr:CRISPR-associated endonuclease Cas1 [Thermoprotei archaeon]